MKSTTKSKNTTKTKGSSNGTAALTKRLGPISEIVKRLPGATKSRYIALLSCGHRYSRGRKWHRTHLRCRACVNGGPAKKAKLVKKAANGTKSTTNGGGAK
jgi:hypothetical protein